MTDLRDFLLAAESFADRVFAIDAARDQSYSYGEFQEWSLCLASILREKGVRKGDRVGIVLPNSIEYALIYFACLYMGAVALPINTTYHPRNIDHIIKSARPRFLVYSSETLNLAGTLLTTHPGIESLCLIPNHHEQAPFTPSLSLKTRDLRNGNITAIMPFEGMTEDDLFTITFTSGTTARPKGICHKIGTYLFSSKIFNRTLAVTEEDRFYHILPMSYMAGLLNLVISPFLAGASIVISPFFDARLAMQFWKIPLKYGVNRFWLVPGMLAMLLKVDRDKNGLTYCHEKVKDAFVGTAPLPDGLKKDFEGKYGFPLWESYGLSETMFVASNHPRFPEKEGSVGKALPGVQVKLEPLVEPRSAEGEICVRSPAMMAGYLNELTSELEPTDVTGWFRTGDIGRIDSDGYLFVTDRKKDLIIKGGVNVSPREIEEVIAAHPAVELVAVIGVPHDLYGEEVAAALVLRPGTDLKEELLSIRRLCEENLEGHSVPAFFSQLPSLPTGPTGKILKRELRDTLTDRKGRKDHG